MVLGLFRSRVLLSAQGLWVPPSQQQQGQTPRCGCFLTFRLSPSDLFQPSVVFLIFLQHIIIISSSRSRSSFSLCVFLDAPPVSAPSTRRCNDPPLLLSASAAYEGLQKINPPCLGFVPLRSKLICLKLEDGENYSVYGNVFVIIFSPGDVSFQFPMGGVGVGGGR